MIIERMSRPSDIAQMRVHHLMLSFPNSAREVYLPHCQFRHDIVGSCLEWDEENHAVQETHYRHTWQLLATNEIQDVHDHQATIKPKNLEYFGPATLAAQMYMEPLNGNAEHTSARTAVVISINTTVIKYDNLKNNEILISFVCNTLTISLRGPQWVILRRMQICFDNLANALLRVIYNVPDTFNEI